MLHTPIHGDSYYNIEVACVRACVRALVHACMRACVHVCVRARVHACVSINCVYVVAACTHNTFPEYQSSLIARI